MSFLFVIDVSLSPADEISKAEEDQDEDETKDRSDPAN